MRRAALSTHLSQAATPDGQQRLKGKSLSRCDLSQGSKRSHTHSPLPSTLLSAGCSGWHNESCSIRCALLCDMAVLGVDAAFECTSCVSLPRLRSQRFVPCLCQRRTTPLYPTFCITVKPSSCGLLIRSPSSFCSLYPHLFFLVLSCHALSSISLCRPV